MTGSKTAYEMDSCLVGSEMCIRDRLRSNVLFNIDKIRQWQIDMTKYIENPERDIEEETQISNFED